MQELRDIVESELQLQQFTSSLENLTDDILILRATNRLRSQTIVQLQRHQHRPFEVEITVDHKLAQPKDIQRISRRSRNSGRGGLSSFRGLWLFFIFFSIIASILSSFVGGFLNLLNSVTPGWSPRQQALGIIGIFLGIFAFWYFVIPKIRQQRNSALSQIDKKLLNSLVNRLIQLNDKVHDEKIIRCWSCFQEVTKEEVFCPHCGERLS